MKLLRILVFLSLLPIYNCSKSVPQPTPEEIEIELNEICQHVLDSGGIAAIGVGVSPRRDIARDKATLAGRANLAKIYQSKVENLSKKFTEEVGSGFDSEINETFSEVTKVLATTTLKGSYPKKVKYFTENFDGKTMHSCYVLMAVEPKILNQSLFDELEKKDNKMYERFRASNAFEELNKAMGDYEKSEHAPK